MALSVLNNIPSIVAENQLDITQNNLQNTLTQLSSGSRINSGADDAAGLAIANGLQANITGLTQSVANANDGVGALQVADGALGQVTTLLNRAVTLATEASTGTVSTRPARRAGRRVSADPAPDRQHRFQHHVQRHHDFRRERHNHHVHLPERFEHGRHYHDRRQHQRVVNDGAGPARHISHRNAWFGEARPTQRPRWR